MTDIKIDGEAMRAVVAKVLIEQVSEEQRAAILAAAVEQLLAEPKDQYGRSSGTSALQQAFNDAVRRVAYDVVKDYLTLDEIRGRVREAIVATTETLIARQSWTVSAIADAVAKRVEDALTDRGETL